MNEPLDIDEALLQEAMEVGGHRDQASAVNTALAEYIKFHQRRRAIELMGTIDFHDDAFCGTGYQPVASGVGAKHHPIHTK